MENLQAPLLDQVSAFLLDAQNADGGFPGRDGPSDPYYTSFAARNMGLLGLLESDVAEKLSGYIQAFSLETANSIDAISTLFTASVLESATGSNPLDMHIANWQESLAARLNTLRRADGGYAKTTEGAAASTYQSFLSVLCFQLLELPIEQPEALLQFILSQQREDGGFVEIRVMRSSGTNPTAAAIALLQILSKEPTLSALQPNIALAEQMAVAFLTKRQTEEGGFAANTKIPFADLLSTFTCVLTLSNASNLASIDPISVAKFAEQLLLPNGGFRAATWDDEADVEYTFYGLATLSLLSSAID